MEYILDTNKINNLHDEEQFEKEILQYMKIIKTMKFNDFVKLIDKFLNDKIDIEEEELLSEVFRYAVETNKLYLVFQNQDVNEDNTYNLCEILVRCTRNIETCTTLRECVGDFNTYVDINEY